VPSFDVTNVAGSLNALLAAVLFPLPTVYTVHGVWSEQLRWRREPKPGKRILYPVLERWALRRVAGVISTDSAGYTGRLVGQLCSARVWEIPNPLSPVDFCLSCLPVEGRILSVGTLYELKNQKLLISALPGVRRRIPEARLVLAGAASSSYAKECVRFASDLGIAQHVDFLGLRSRDAIRRELSCADVFALPSLSEVAPQAIAEAMAAGVPVVAAPVGGIPGMITDGADGFLVPSDDVEAWTQRLTSIISDRSLRARLGASARARAVRTYDPGAVAEATLRVLQTVVSGPG
jgi:glycosyltransferase involved in cell wall biosynthesis